LSWLAIIKRNLGFGARKTSRRIAIDNGSLTTAMCLTYSTLLHDIFYQMLFKNKLCYKQHPTFDKNCHVCVCANFTQHLIFLNVPACHQAIATCPLQQQFSQISSNSIIESVCPSTSTFWKGCFMDEHRIILPTVLCDERGAGSPPQWLLI
jgi:hypothetical protein